MENSNYTKQEPPASSIREPEYSQTFRVWPGTTNLQSRTSLMLPSEGYNQSEHGPECYQSSYPNFSQNDRNTAVYNSGSSPGNPNQTQASPPLYFPQPNFIGPNATNVKSPNPWSTWSFPVDSFYQGNVPYAPSAMTFDKGNFSKNVMPDTFQNFPNSPYISLPTMTSNNFNHIAFVKCERDDESQVSTTCQDYPFVAPSSPSNCSKNVTRNESRSRSRSVDTTNTRLPGEKVNFSEKKCLNCKTVETVLWRKIKDTDKYICNACGLYYKLHCTNRPIRLWKNTINRRKSKSKVGKVA